MSQPLPISAFIICFNEAGRIGNTLESVKGLVDEIIVVDSGSNDGTQEIAEQYGAKVMYHSWQGYGPQKRFAEEQCTHDWVLNLDADEVLSDALIQEIRTAFTTPASDTEDSPPRKWGGQGGGDSLPDGYIFNIRDCIPGESRPRLFAHNTRAVRLYNKTKGRYANSPVHDRVQFENAFARTHTLSAPVYHYSFISLEQAIDKFNRYSTLQVEDMQARKAFPKFLGARIILEFPIAFFKSYIMRGDILRGLKGFANAITYAFSRFARIAKAWEKRD